MIQRRNAVWIPFFDVQEDGNGAKSNIRVLVNVGTAQVELLKDPQRGSSDVNPLARFMIGGLWVSYRMTYAGQPSER